MKIKGFILIGIAMSLLTFPINAKVSISIEGNNLIATTNQQGTAGLKGCSLEEAINVSGYVFELQMERLSNNACEIQQHKGWRTIAKRTSDKPSVIFNNLGNSNYRVLCKVGKPIGCMILNSPSHLPNKSIVYEIEKSVSTRNSKNQALKASLKLSETNLTIFPNPSEGVINISLTEHSLTGPTQLTLLDVLGKVVYSEDLDILQASVVQFKLDISHLSEGAYFVKMSDRSGKSYSGKVVHHSK